MTKPIRLLFVESAPPLVEPILALLRQEGYEPICEVVDSEALFRAALGGPPWDAIFCAHPVTRLDPLTMVRKVRERGLDTPFFILASGESSAEFLIDAMRAGATDYIRRERPARLLPALARELRDAEHRRARREAEAALQLRERCIDAISQGVVITGPRSEAPGQPDCPIIYVNAAFGRITGYSAAEVIGESCDFLKGPDTDPSVAAELRRAIRGGQSCTVEILNYRKDGTPFWNNLSVSPIRGEKGQVTHHVGVMTDVTERRRLEEQYRHMQKLDNVGQLAGGVAHDFNNLLTVVTGYSEMLLHDMPEDDARRACIQEIHKAGERGTQLTKQLLTFSRKQPFSPRIVDLQVILRDMERLIRRLLREDIELATQLENCVQKVFVDPHQVEMAVMNLVVNARDAMPNGGKVTISLAEVNLDAAYARYHPGVQPGQYVMLSVADTGHGMDAATRQRVFEPFFTTKPKGVGTGLGLATVYGIVRQSNGHVSVYSELGMGAVFRIYFPCAAQPRAESVELPPSQVQFHGSETVLIVEDDDAVRSLAGSILRTHGYNVLDASDPAAALRVCDDYTGKIDLVLTDLVMPRMNGTEFAQRIRSLRPGVRVLFTSGYSKDAVHRSGAAVSEETFVQKPYSTDSLMRKVRAALDMHLEA